MTADSCSSKYFDVVIQEAYFRHTANHVQHMIQRLVQVGFIIAHSRHSQRRLLPEIVVIDLGHRDIELIPYPVLQAAKGMSLILERPAVGNMDLYGANSNKHRSCCAGDHE